MQRGIRKRDLDELNRDYSQNKENNNIEFRECNMWESVKEEENVRNNMRKNFPFQQPMKQKKVLAKIRQGKWLDMRSCNRDFRYELKYT